jgi:hemerythrin-like metal-binding protein
MSIEWKEEYLLGLQKIDNQHKNLFKIMNELYNIINEKKDFTLIKNLIKELNTYAEEHFGLEEGYFEKFNFELKEHHIKFHREFKEKIIELELKNKEDKIQACFDLIDYLENWFLGHVLHEDKQYVDLFKSHGIE